MNTTQLTNKLTTVDCVNRLLETNLNFRVHVSLEDLGQILASFQVYNGMPDTLLPMVGAIKEAIGPMQFPGDNPNNGSFDHIRVSIGNEGSLVMYVELATAYIKGRELEVASKLEMLGKKFNCDECTMERQSFALSLRLWWD